MRRWKVSLLTLIALLFVAQVALACHEFRENRSCDGTTLVVVTERRDYVNNHWTDWYVVSTDRTENSEECGYTLPSETPVPATETPTPETETPVPATEEPQAPSTPVFYCLSSWDMIPENQTAMTSSYGPVTESENGISVMAWQPFAIGSIVDVTAYTADFAEEIDYVVTRQIDEFNWACELPSSVPTPAPIVEEQFVPVAVPYGNCEPKILVERMNNATHEGWDSMDVIAIQDPLGEQLFSNVTTGWGEGLDSHPSLSWDACWFVEQRFDEAGDGYLVWSPFGEKIDIRINGKLVFGEDGDVGPHGEIAYRDTETGELMLTDRYGSFVRHLDVQGTDPEFNTTGEWISFRTTTGWIDRVSVHGRESGYEISISRGSLPHQHPSDEDTVFYQNRRMNQGDLSLVGALVSQVMVDEAADMAINPAGNEAYLTYGGELFFTEDWQSDTRKQVYDPFDQNTSDNYQAIFLNGDWRD